MLFVQNPNIKQSILVNPKINLGNLTNKKILWRENARGVPPTMYTVHALSCVRVPQSLPGGTPVLVESTSVLARRFPSPGKDIPESFQEATPIWGISQSIQDWVPPESTWDHRLGRDLEPETEVPPPTMYMGPEAGKGPGTRDWGTPFQVWTDKVKVFKV